MLKLLIIDIFNFKNKYQKKGNGFRHRKNFLSVLLPLAIIYAGKFKRHLLTSQSTPWTSSFAIYPTVTSLDSKDQWGHRTR